MNQEPRQYLFVVNPISGDTDKSQLPNQIKQSCGQANVRYSIYETQGEEDAANIGKEIERLKPEAVIACGGDGTVGLVAGQLLDNNIALGIIPLGSANGLATELSISYSPSAELSWLFSGQTRQVDVIRINESLLCLHLSDMGFNARIIEEFEKEEVRGMLGYARSFFHSLKQKESQQYRISGKSLPEAIEVSADMIVIANASSYGTGAVINPGSDLSDGQLELVIFKPIPPRHWPSITFETFFGNIHNSEYVDFLRGSAFEIQCPAGEVLQVDGELIGRQQTVQARVLPGALKLLVP